MNFEKIDPIGYLDLDKYKLDLPIETEKIRVICECNNCKEKWITSMELPKFGIRTTPKRIYDYCSACEKDYKLKKVKQKSK